MKSNFRPQIYQNKKGKVVVFLGLCKGCGLCLEKCPVGAIKFSPKDLGCYGLPAVTVEMAKCILCGLCQQTCPDCALRVEKKK